MIFMSSLRKLRVDYTLKKMYVWTSAIFVIYLYPLLRAEDNTQGGKCGTDASLGENKVSNFYDIWEPSEGYINTFLFLPWNLWHIGHFKWQIKCSGAKNWYMSTRFLIEENWKTSWKCKCFQILSCLMLYWGCLL